jgi:hypothetical protein
MDAGSAECRFEKRGDARRDLANAHQIAQQYLPQSLINICYEIIDMFDAHRQPHQVFGQSQFRFAIFGHARMTHRARMPHDAFHTAKPLGDCKILESINELGHIRLLAVERESHDRAET